MAFKGWPAEAIEFYEGLEADNSKAYWHDHKPVYEATVLRPMEALLAELEPSFGRAKVFRPNRDIRFSKDKSPYKTAIAASLESGGYVSFSASGLSAGSGFYMLAPDQLERYRAAVAADRTGTDLDGIVGKLGKAGYEVTAHETLKTIPRGYPKDHARADLLRQKGLIAWKQWPVGAWLGTAAAKKKVADLLGAAQPLMGWLTANVGDTTVAEHGRR